MKLFRLSCFEKSRFFRLIFEYFIRRKYQDAFQLVSEIITNRKVRLHQIQRIEWCTTGEKIKTEQQSTFIQSTDSQVTSKRYTYIPGAGFAMTH